MSLAARTWHEMVDEIEGFLDEVMRDSARAPANVRRGEQGHAPIH
jgi:hypothetical protein